MRVVRTAVAAAAIGDVAHYPLTFVGTAPAQVGAFVAEVERLVVADPEAASYTPAPILCARDAWKAIVALLDSGETQLNVDPSPGLPTPMPSGFAAVGSQASPSTTPGSFAA